MNLPQKLKTLRNSAGLSVYKLAQLADVSSTYIHEIEQGKKQPTVEIMSRICCGLGITLSEFFSDEAPDMPPDLRRLLETAKELDTEQRETLQRFLETIKK